MKETSSVNTDQPAEPGDMTSTVLPKQIVVIGASVGGQSALAQIVPKFPVFFPGAIIIVQRMRPGFTKLLARILATESSITIREAENLNPIYPGLALLTPGASACTMTRNNSWSRHPLTINVDNLSNLEDKSVGPIDIAMKSAAEVYGEKVIGVMLTGIGEDGREGLRAIKEHGGLTIAQDESTSTLSDAPRMVADLGLASEILPLWAIPNRILEIVGE